MPFDLRQDVVEVVERFDPRTQRRGMVPHHAYGDDLQPLLVQLGRIEGDLVGDDDDLRVAAPVGIEAQRADAPGHHHADVTVLNAVDGQRVLDRLGHLLSGHGDFQPNHFGRVPQAFQVLGHAEHFAGVTADAFEHAVAIKQTVIVDADLGVFFVVELSVDVDFQGHDGRGYGIRELGIGD